MLATAGSTSIVLLDFDGIQRGVDRTGRVSQIAGNRAMIRVR